jgi:hypothetical protein
VQDADESTSFASVFNPEYFATLGVKRDNRLEISWGRMSAE